VKINIPTKLVISEERKTSNDYLLADEMPTSSPPNVYWGVGDKGDNYNEIIKKLTIL